MRPDIRQAWSDAAYRERVQQWARDNRLDPNDLALDVEIDDDGTVHLTRYLRDDNGRLHLRPGTNQIASIPMTVIEPDKPFPIPEQRQVTP